MGTSRTWYPFSQAFSESEKFHTDQSAKGCLCLIPSCLAEIKREDLLHNEVLHSDKRHDLLISPSIVACSFLLPAETAQLVGRYKQVSKVMICRN